ncbi:MAG: low molecular weight phosphotyrosine protein phosphatase [Anaerolineales bacterium]|nr:low molecular weight phosphotyrosine protein phosphatase [Anaerolineales bacterium]
MKICFVCQGNIIRSPLAEHIFLQLADEKGVVDKYFVDSAGTIAYHAGERPDRRMRQVAAERGLVYSGRAKQFKRDDFARFDLIIAMDKANRQSLQGWAVTTEQDNKIHLMREFDSQGEPNLDVPDPYYGGPDGFVSTFEIVKRSCEGLLEELEGGQYSP